MRYVSLEHVSRKLALISLTPWLGSTEVIVKYKRRGGWADPGDVNGITDKIMSALCQVIVKIEFLLIGLDWLDFSSRSSSFTRTASTTSTHSHCNLSGRVRPRRRRVTSEDGVADLGVTDLVHQLMLRLTHEDSQCKRMAPFDLG